MDCSYMAVPGIKKNIPITLENIERAVCKFYNIQGSDLRKKVRKREVVQPRQVSMNLSHYKTKHSLAAIGEYFGGFDHATVLHARNTVDNLLETNKIFKQEFEQIEQSLNK